MSAGTAVGAGGAGSAGTDAGVTTPTTAAPDDDPPRTSYARLSCPDAVVVDTAFDVIVGLAPQPDERVVGEAMTRPPSSVGAYTITIQLVAAGMRLAEPTGTWRVDLPVTADEPYPAATVRLVADPTDQPITSTSIRAMYSVDGSPIGLAVRSVAIVGSAELIDRAPVATKPAPGVDLALPPGQVAPDLTVRIERAESQQSGRLLVQLLAADPAVDTPDAPVLIDIGGDPAADLRRIINEMTEVEGKPTQYVALRGIGLAIADQLPIEFWNVLADVAARVRGRAPTILFLSAEPYVPWELAVVDPPLDPDLPPFLAAQATVGRWLLGQRRPPLPPPMSVTVGGSRRCPGSTSYRVGSDWSTRKPKRPTSSASQGDTGRRHDHGHPGPAPRQAGGRRHPFRRPWRRTTPSWRWTA